MKLKNILILSATLVATSGIMSSCADKLDLKNPNAYDFGSFYENQKQFEGNITAIMNQWRSSLTPDVYFKMGDLRSGIFELTDYLDGSALIYPTEIQNSLSVNYTQFSNYNGMFGIICNLNLFIHYANERADLLDPQAREYMLGMVYGMRAYCYFLMHKMYGTCPLELTPDVSLGVTDPNELQRQQPQPSVIVAQIKEDIAASLAAFNKGEGYVNSVFTAKNGVHYWTKAATEMLAGEAYLWFGKVSTGDWKANDADVLAAESYLKNVINNYGKGLQSNYYDIWRTKGNNEVIFASYYDRAEATWNFRYVQPTLYVANTGQARGSFWWNIADPSQASNYDATTMAGADRVLPRTTTATRFAYNEKYTGSASQSNSQTLTQLMPTMQNECQIKNAFARQFKDGDQRSLMLVKAYLITPEDLGYQGNTDANGAALFDGPKVYVKPNFDPDTTTLAGAMVYKFPGQNAQSSPYTIVGGNDQLYYRLATAYLYLAEIANYKGVNSDVETYINKIRERAYGENWDANKYGYTAGTFAENETAILQEAAKEFLFEGKRWFDLRRMTVVKGGTEKDHIIFQPQSCIGWGLDPADFPGTRWNEVSRTWARALDATNVIVTDEPVLNYQSQANQVLWPLTTSMLTGQNNLLQTPGYGDASW